MTYLHECVLVKILLGISGINLNLDAESYSSLELFTCKTIHALVVNRKWGKGTETMTSSNML